MPVSRGFSKGLETGVYQQMLDAAPDAMLLVDQTGLIRFANQRSKDIFQYEPQELVGQKVEMLVPRIIAEAHIGMRENYFATPNIRAMGSGLNINARRKDSVLVPVEISLSPITIGGDRFAITVIRDVDDLRRAQRELRDKARKLEQSNRDLEQFAYVASHDLQEPLRMVASYTTLLKRRYADKLDQDANEFIGFAIGGVKRMQALISDLLIYSRISTREAPMTEVPLQEIVDQAKHNLQVAFDEKKAIIETGPLPVVFGNAGQLVQLLQNLIGNAVKFCGKQPRVSVTAKDLGDRVEIVVADNGIGIARAHQEKIFMIFQRLHAREQYEGTGIGLAICERVVSQHGGKIWVESEEGQGAKFIFTLLKEGRAREDG